MTLGGLTVDEWLAAQPAPAAPAPPRPRRPRPAPTAGRVRWLWWAIGAVVGAALVLANLDVSVACPPEGEGEGWCVLHRHVLRLVMTFLLAATATACGGQWLTRALRPRR